jgi:signal recognition particle receptor subunit beta
VANKRDLPNALTLDEIRKKLKLPEKFKLVECVATNPKSVQRVLETLIEELEKKSDKAA